MNIHHLLQNRAADWCKSPSFQLSYYPILKLLTIFRESPTCGDLFFKCYFENLRTKNFLYLSNQSAVMILPELSFIWHVFRKTDPIQFYPR